MLLIDKIKDIEIKYSIEDQDDYNLKNIYS